MGTSEIKRLGQGWGAGDSWLTRDAKGRTRRHRDRFMPVDGNAVAHRPENHLTGQVSPPDLDVKACGLD
jgi:hypothetical protein